MTPHAIGTNGKRINYHVSGNGKPLLLIHGFGFDARVWEPILPSLEQKAKVIRVELPGFGGSDIPDGEPSLDVYADAVVVVMKNENIPTCPVVGHSMGGYVALNLLERHGGLVEALGLFHSHPFADTEEQKEKRTKDAAFIERNGSEKFIPVLIPKLFAEAFTGKQKDVVDGLVEQNKNLDANALMYALNAMRSRPDRSEVVASLNKPFLWIAGGRDQVIPVESVNKMYALPQVASGLFLREAGHMGMVENTPASAGHILNWMALVSNG